MKYTIYSDESGSWNSSQDDEHYVRCWIKKPVGRRISDSLFLDKNVKIYFTFTKIAEFKQKPFRVKNKIKEKVDASFLELGELIKPYMMDIPKAVESAVNKVLFLNLYEHFAWEDAKLTGLFNGVEEYQIHKPQFTNTEYKKLLEEDIGIDVREVSLISGDKNAGINLADKYAGKLRKVLKSDFNNPTVIKDLKAVIDSSAVNGAKLSSGIDKVFWDPRNVPDDKEIMIKIRNHLG